MHIAEMLILGGKCALTPKKRKNRYHTHIYIYTYFSSSHKINTRHIVCTLWKLGKEGAEKNHSYAVLGAERG